MPDERPAWSADGKLGDARVLELRTGKLPVCLEYRKKDGWSKQTGEVRAPVHGLELSRDNSACPRRTELQKSRCPPVTRLSLFRSFPAPYLLKAGDADSMSSSQIRRPASPTQSRGTEDDVRTLVRRSVREVELQYDKLVNSAKKLAAEHKMRIENEEMPLWEALLELQMQAARDHNRQIPRESSLWYSTVHHQLKGGVANLDHVLAVLEFVREKGQEASSQLYRQRYREVYGKPSTKDSKNKEDLSAEEKAQLRSAAVNGILVCPFARGKGLLPATAT